MVRWERERDVRNITGYSMRDVNILKNGSEADVMVVVKEYTTDTMSLKKKIYLQRWVARGLQWLFLSEVDVTRGKPPTRR